MNYTFASSDGYAEGGALSDSYANHDEWHVDADGRRTSSWTSTGEGHDTWYFNIEAGANYLRVTGRDADSYSASGGTDADGYNYIDYNAGVGEIHGDDEFTRHVEDDLGNVLDETGTDYYQSQTQVVNDDESNSVAYGGTANYTLTHPDGTSDAGVISYSYPEENVASASAAQQSFATARAAQQQAPAAQQQAPQQNPAHPRRRGRRAGDFSEYFPSVSSGGRLATVPGGLQVRRFANDPLPALAPMYFERAAAYFPSLRPGQSGKNSNAVDFRPHRFGLEFEWNLFNDEQSVIIDGGGSAYPPSQQVPRN